MCVNQPSSFASFPFNFWGTFLSKKKKKSMLLSFPSSPFLYFSVTNYSFNLESGKETGKVCFFFFSKGWNLIVKVKWNHPVLQICRGFFCESKPLKKSWWSCCSWPVQQAETEPSRDNLAHISLYSCSLKWPALYSSTSVDKYCLCFLSFWR